MSKIGNDSLSKRNAEYIDNVIDKNLDQNMNTITDKTKESLVETFMVAQSVNSDNAAQQIEDIRTEQLRTWDKVTGMHLRSLNSLWLHWWISIKKYSDIYEVYNTLISDWSILEEDKKEQLEKVDNMLAARIILDSSVSSVSHSFKKRALFEKKETRDEAFDLIKDSYKEWEDFLIHTKERDLSSGHYYSIERKDEVWDIEPEIEEEREEGWEDNELEEEEREDNDESESEEEFILLDDELDVNFSDMNQTIKDISDERVYNKDSKEYVDAMEKKNSPFGRMLVSAKRAMFWDLFRFGANKKLVKSMTNDKEKEWLDLTSNWADIAWVHANQWVESVYTLLEGDPKYNWVYDEISNLSKEYYKGGSSFVDWVSWEVEFETKLKKIFTNNPNFTKELKKKWVDIDKSAWDILQTLKIKRAQNKFKFEIRILVDNTLSKKKWLKSDDPTLTTIENDFVSQLTSKFKLFTSNTQLYPEILQHYNKMNTTGDKINLGDSYENISRQLFAHIDALKSITTVSMTNKVKLNIKFLSKWHSTDHIDKNKDEEFKRYKNPISKLWDVMYWKGHRWRRWTTKALTTWLAAAAGTAIFGPLWWILAGSITAWSLAAGKKAAQLKRKKESLEKEYIKDTKNTSNFINETENDQLDALRSIANFTDIKKSFDKILADSPLDDKKLLPVLSLLMAWLEFQKKTWHNGFSIDNSSKWTTDLEKEHQYDKMINEVHKYKKLAFMRLNLQWSSIDENWIKKQTEYKTILDTYMGGNSKFNKFVKSFKKNRSKSMLKTWARTAAIYAAAWGLSRWLHHILWWSSVDASSISPTDNFNTNYGLWKFDASPSFSNNVGSKLSNLPSDTSSVHVDYFAWVDGTPANAASFTTQIINKQVSNIQHLLNTGNYSQATIDSVNDAISQSNITNMTNLAKIQWADIWNQNLFTSRNLEWIYEVLKQANGKNNIDFDFNLDKTQSIIWNTPYVPTDRITWVDLTDIVKHPVDPGGSSSSRYDWQWLYTEDNTHKWEDNF